MKWPSPDSKSRNQLVSLVGRNKLFKTCPVNYEDYTCGCPSTSSSSTSPRGSTSARSPVPCRNSSLCLSPGCLGDHLVGSSILVDHAHDGAAALDHSRGVDRLAGIVQWGPYQSLLKIFCKHPQTERQPSPASLGSHDHEPPLIRHPHHTPSAEEPDAIQDLGATRAERR